MRKLVAILFIAISISLGANPPANGGYLGKRIIVCVEGSYSPNYAKWQDFLLSYNLQYGGNVHFITGRYSQLGLSYNMFSLGAHQKYDTALSNNGKIRGYQVGLTYRKFRQKLGGLAPIGKFLEFSLNYSSSNYNVQFTTLQTFAPVQIGVKKVSATVGLGTQEIFWGRLVANGGIRIGAPILVLGDESSGDSGGTYRRYMHYRLLYKDIFSVFFGVGIIL